MFWRKDGVYYWFMDDESGGHLSTKNGFIQYIEERSNNSKAITITHG